VRCAVTLSREHDAVVARCAEFPSCEGRGPTSREALDRLRASVLFWVESCPCDVTVESGLVLDVVSDRSGG